MACETPCFDCPFLKTAESMQMEEVALEEYMFEHLTGDGYRGGFDPIECPEQGDICFGQIQVISNMHFKGADMGLDPFSDIGEAVEALEHNKKDYFQGLWDFGVFHRSATDALERG